VAILGSVSHGKTTSIQGISFNGLKMASDAEFGGLKWTSRFS